MSCGPPRNGAPRAAVTGKPMHRLAERFKRNPDDVKAEQHVEELKRTLRSHLYAADAGFSWLDALFFERFYCQGVVPAAAIKLPGPATSGNLPVWTPTVEALETLVAVLDQQECLRQQCLRAIMWRNRVIVGILTQTCYGARQVESREKELRRMRAGSPTLRGDTTGHAQSFSFQELWPTDLLRHYLKRVSAAPEADFCCQGHPRVRCSVESHSALANLLEELDCATDEVVAQVIRWRAHLNRPQPFLFEGHNILLQVQNDLETLVPSLTAHLVDQAGGQSSYNPRDCAFHYVSRYTGGQSSTGILSPVAGSSNQLNGRGRVFSFSFLPSDVPFSRSCNPNVAHVNASKRLSSSTAGDGAQIGVTLSVDPGISKTLAYVVARELNVQMKLVEDSLKLVNEAGMHVVPVIFHYVPLTSSPLGRAASTLPTYMIESRGDASLIRRYVQRTRPAFATLPMLMTAPKKWFPPHVYSIVERDLRSIATVASGRESVAASDDSWLLQAVSGMDFPSTTPPNGGAKSLHPDNRGLLSSAASKYTTVVIVDEKGRLTLPGMFVLLRREMEHAPCVVTQTHQWLRQCYSLARTILEEPIGSIVEPRMQALRAQQAEEAALRAQLVSVELLGVDDVSKSTLKRKLLKQRAMANAAATHAKGSDDFGTDETLDRLVEVCYATGSAVRPSDAPPLETDADKDAHHRLITLQRRSVKRFGLRVLRAWTRFHLAHLHRHEVALDLLNKNMTLLLRRRFLVWAKLVQRRRVVVRRVDLLCQQAEMALVRRRFIAWKVAHLSRAVAKNFNGWLYDAAYHRWLYVVCRKRVAVCLSQPVTPPSSDAEERSGGHHRWMTALAEVGRLTHTKRKTPFLDALNRMSTLPNE